MYSVSHQRTRLVCLALEDIHLQLNQPIKMRREARHVSSSDASALDGIPAVTVLQRLLLKETGEDQNYEMYFTYSCTEALF